MIVLVCLQDAHFYRSSVRSILLLLNLSIIEFMVRCSHMSIYMQVSLLRISWVRWSIGIGFWIHLIVLFGEIILIVSHGWMMHTHYHILCKVDISLVVLHTLLSGS